MKKSIAALLLIFLFTTNALAQDSYFIMGSGEINLIHLKKGSSGKIKYRSSKGYDEAALRKINAIYGGNYDKPNQRMSLRFLEVLSYLQNHFGGAPLMLRSGYRNPDLNQKLRAQGKLAAQSSMHIEAAAADFYLQGVDVLALKEFATAMTCCGVGFYHGKHIHLDTGPKRWWDEKTSGTEKMEPQENEKIIVLTDKDIYSPGEKMSFDYLRVSNYPFSSPSNVQLEKLEKNEWKKSGEAKVVLPFNSTNTCQDLSDRSQIKGLKLEAIKPLVPGRYRFTLLFCNKKWAKMPDLIESNEFEVRK